MPDASKEYARLHRFVGRWVGDDVLHSSPGGVGRGHADTLLTMRPALDGRVVLGDEMRRRGGCAEITRLVFGYDPRAGHFTLHRSSGAAPLCDCAAAPGCTVARGSWDGDSLTFVEEAAEGLLRHRYAFRGTEHHSYELSVWSPRGWRSHLKGTYHRDSPDHPARYGRQADAIARTYMAHGAAPAEAEHDAWALVMGRHRPSGRRAATRADGSGDRGETDGPGGETGAPPGRDVPWSRSRDPDVVVPHGRSTPPGADP